jgi:hypothetical protein
MIRFSETLWVLFFWRRRLGFPFLFLGEKEGRAFIPKKKVGSISLLEPEFFHGREDSVHIQAGLIIVQSTIKDQTIFNQSSYFIISRYLFHP